MTFNIDKTVKYWLDGSAYDFETSRNLITAGKFPYALFFGHLSLEKLLKAIVVKKTQAHAPRSHSLTLLAEDTTLSIPAHIMDKLAVYTAFNIETKYPNDREYFYKNIMKISPRIKLRKWRTYINGC